MNAHCSKELLLNAQAHIWNHIFNFVNPISLKCAIEIGVPDIIHNHGKPMTLSELITALPIHPTKALHVYRLMRILIHSGFFAPKNTNENDQEEAYVLTESSKLLLKDNPLSVTLFLLAMVDPMLTTPWNYLTTWFQNEDLTPFDTAHGKTFWDYGGDEPKFANIFNDAMASDARLVMSIVVDKCKGVFEGLKSFVDVGGTVTKAIADTFPEIESTVFDLPHVVADFQGSKNLKYVGGDMFEAGLPADAVFMKEAITTNDKKGKVIIIELMMENQKEDKKSTKTQIFFDMVMMVLVKGRERNEKEWAKLFMDAGFSNYKITPILGLRALVEVYP
ncbi:hypothetical protein ACJW30_06G118400 [Castanea mollissima]